MAFDFDAAVQAPFRMQPGLRRLDAGAAQLSIAGRGSRHLIEKLAVLGEAPHSALVTAPGFDAAPALQALAAQAALEHPASFGWDGRKALAMSLGWAVDVDGHVGASPAHAPMAEVGDTLRRLPQRWRLAALLSLALAEDFAIIDGRTAQIPWLAVTLPSHWVPESKVGQHFAEVHAPVADGHRLRAAGDALMRLVSAPARWERFVWTITPNARLDAHPARQTAAGWQGGPADAVAAQAHWRTERQTFIPVPDAGQAVFTIRVDSQPLLEAIDTPHKAARLRDALASMSPAVQRYRQLAEVQPALQRWLAQRAVR